MKTLSEPDIPTLLFAITPQGELAVERVTTRDQEAIHLAGGGKIITRTIRQRGERLLRPLPYFAAITDMTQAEALELIRPYIGFVVPGRVVNELRLFLLRRVMDGQLVLAGKKIPLAADASWHRFDPDNLSAWDFNFDGTASVWGVVGQTYCSVTLFTPEQWAKVAGAPPKQPPEAVLNWMRAAYSAPVKPKAKAAIADCMKATGATDREARAALAQVPERRKRGKPRGSRPNS